MQRTYRLGLAVILLLPATAARAQHESHGGAPPEKLGKVHFENSCSEAVRADFDRAAALLHSFWWSAAIDGFRGVIAKDPTCATAYWGIALSQRGNPFAGGPSARTVQDGLATVEKGKGIGAKTARENAYLDAVEKLYKDPDKVDSRARAVAYEKAMEEVARAYPSDPEARIFYALAVSANAPPTDKSYANLLKAAGILEKELAKQPDHPGLAHYIIHSYDVPALAPRALAAARSYAKIAPSAPHALHMPSHTFTRVGSWQESIDTNIASAEAARRANAPGEVLHAFDYQAYAYLQTARDGAAKRVLDQLAPIATLPNEGGQGLAGSFALAAIPARYALERHSWSEAAALEPRKSPLAYTEAMTHFARALGAARGGNAAAARADVERLAALRDALKQAKDEFWTEQVEIQRKAAEAWVMFAEGKKDEALALLRGAADQEDLTEKSAVTPGPLAPARELLGEMLLEANQPREALTAFEATTRKEPNRFRGVYGAGRAAELAGDKAKARQYYGQLLTICERADAERPELLAARKFLGKAAPPAAAAAKR